MHGSVQSNYRKKSIEAQKLQNLLTLDLTGSTNSITSTPLEDQNKHQDRSAKDYGVCQYRDSTRVIVEEEIREEDDKVCSEELLTTHQQIERLTNK